MSISRYYIVNFLLTLEASGGFCVSSQQWEKVWLDLFLSWKQHVILFSLQHLALSHLFATCLSRSVQCNAKLQVISISQISRKNTFCRIYSFPSMCGNKNLSPTHNRVASDPSGSTRLRQTSAHTWDEAHCLSFHGAGKQTLIQKDCSLYGT